MWFKKRFIKKYCLRPEISLLRVGQNPKKSRNSWGCQGLFHRNIIIFVHSGISLKINLIFFKTWPGEGEKIIFMKKQWFLDIWIAIKFTGFKHFYLILYEPREKIHTIYITVDKILLIWTQITSQNLDISRISVKINYIFFSKHEPEREKKSFSWNNNEFCVFELQSS